MNWFDFKKERITGWAYLGRCIVGLLGFVLVIPGFWLISSTVYKRSASFNHSNKFNIFCATLLPINFFFDFILRIQPDVLDDFFINLAISMGDMYYIIIALLYLPVFIHIYLLFFNANKLSYIQMKEREFSEGKISIEEFNSIVDKENSRSN